MKNVKPKPIQFFILAIFLSILIHATIMLIFTFKLPMQKQSFQPYFNFLGSILIKHDLSNNPNFNTTFTDEFGFIRVDPLKPSAENIIELKKPSHNISQTKTEEKTFIKSTFLAPDTKVENQTDNQDIGLDLEPITAYRPLKFQSP